MAYLLVPPAVLGAFAVAVARRGRTLPTSVLLVGVISAGQLAVYAWLQFAGTVQTVEEHYFSSTLWAGVCLAFAITVAELARPLAGRPVARWLPAAVLPAVPLGYEADPHVPSFGWAPTGVILAAAVAALVLTVAPIPSHPLLPGTALDPPPAYSSALGGSSAAYIDSYRIATALPQFTGPAAYRGEELFIWWPVAHSGPGPYTEYTGMFHGWFNGAEQPAEPDRARPPVANGQAADRAATAGQFRGQVPRGAARAGAPATGPDTYRGAAGRLPGPASVARPARHLLPPAADRSLTCSAPSGCRS